MLGVQVRLGIPRTGIHNFDDMLLNVHMTHLYHDALGSKHTPLTCSVEE